MIYESPCPFCKQNIKIEQNNQNNSGSLFWGGCVLCHKVSFYFSTFDKTCRSYNFDIRSKDIWEVYGHKEVNSSVLKKANDFMDEHAIFTRYIPFDFSLSLEDGIAKIIKKMEMYKNFK